MKILFFSPRQCDPPNTGAKLREYHLMRQLSRQASVELLAFAAGPGEMRLPFCGRVHTSPRPPRYTVGKICRGLLGGQPLPLLNYRSDGMAAALEAVLTGRREAPFDAIVLESLHMEAYRNELDRFRNGALLVYDWHNIESELLRRYASRENNPAKRLYARETARRLERVERGILGGDSAHFVCSERERVQLLRWRPQAKVAVVPNGVDGEAFADNSAHERCRILFVGSMDYGPNRDAVEWFAHRVWPGLRNALRTSHPRMRFTVVGSNPPASLQRLQSMDGIEVTGSVQSVVPYYAEAAIVVTPLLAGGGTRLKVVESMAAGVPVVSTPLGAEGIDARHGEEVVLIEPGNPADWEREIVSLLDDAARWSAISRNGKRLALSRYDWRGIGDALARHLREWTAKADSPRAPR